MYVCVAISCARQFGKGDVLMLFHTISLIARGNAEFYESLAPAVEKDDAQLIARSVNDLAEKLNYYSVFCNHQEQAMADVTRLQLAPAKHNVFNQVSHGALRLSFFLCLLSLSLLF